MDNCQTTGTKEKSKPMVLTVQSLVGKMDQKTILFNHPLQRSSGQWSLIMKGNLISDIIQHNPLPELIFAEQVVNDMSIIWDLDGKQRCTNVYDYIHDTYKISKNIRRWDIEYKHIFKDDQGVPILDEFGFPTCESRRCDIRGKKFSDLPVELQELILDYTFNIIQYLNCSAEDISYHIARYNEGKAANPAQKGIIKLGEVYAKAVRGLASMELFRELGNYSSREFTNGTINRVVTECVMACNFLDDWKKSPEAICEFLKVNATLDHFDDMENIFQRLENIISDDTAEWFNSKHTYLWCWLLKESENYKLNDEQFKEFMEVFATELHSKEVDGVTFDDLNVAKSTKDKAVVMQKIEHLNALLKYYFNISDEDYKEVEHLSLDKNWTDYVTSLSKGELIQRMDISFNQMKKIAIEAIMLQENRFDLSNESMQKYVDEYCISETEVTDMQYYLECLTDYIDHLDTTKYIVQENNLPVLISIVKHLDDLEINNDDVVVDFLSRWLEKSNGLTSAEIFEEYQRAMQEIFDKKSIA